MQDADLDMEVKQPLHVGFTINFLWTSIPPPGDLQMYWTAYNSHNLQPLQDFNDKAWMIQATYKLQWYLGTHHLFQEV